MTIVKASKNLRSRPSIFLLAIVLCLNLAKDCTFAKKLDEFAEDILKIMKPDVNPCDDFYEYSCGGWAPEKPQVKNLWDNTKLKLLKMVEIWKKAKDITRQKAYSYYASCMKNDTDVDVHGKEGLLKLIKDLGNTSLLGAPHAKMSDVSNSLKVLFKKYFLSVFVSITVSEFKRENDEIYITTEDATPGLHINDIRSSYVKLINSTLASLGSSLNKHDLLKKINEIVNFELTLAELKSNSSKHFENSQINRSELQKTLDFFDWTEILDNPFALASISISKNEKIEILYPSYLKKLNSFLKQTDPDLLRNYIVWKGIFQTMEWSSREIRNQYLQFTHTNGIRWNHCFLKIMDNSILNNILSFDYLKQYDLNTLKKNKKQIESIFKEEKEIYKEKIKNSSWLDSKSRTLLVEKLEGMQIKTSVWGQISNESHLEKVLQNVQINSSLYFKNNFNLNKAHKLDKFRLLHTSDPTSNYEAWVYFPYPFFNHVFNYVFLPSAIWALPFYDPKRSLPLNYGGIGTLIAHEISHAFNTNGLTWDSKGVNRKWLSNAAMEKIKNISQCFIKQYQNFEIFGEHVNAEKTLSENICDSVAVDVAYKTYKKSAKKLNKIPSNSGINMTDDQMFFLSFSQTHCYNGSKEAVIKFIKTNHHAPYNFRIIGSLSNSFEFAKAFNCKLGSKMNPSTKCQFW